MSGRRNGARATGQTVDGLLVVDKPSGMTSHDVVAIARRRLGERKIGHTGTLDPLATGVLPLACGRATRLIRFLSSDTKDYEATVRFGMTTDTYDVTGTVSTRTDARPDPDRIEAALVSLRGDYLQRPPAFSAKKVGGRRAYDLARHREPMELRAVPVRVARAELLRMEDGRGVFAITCSAGFYVRTFAHALGELVGTGACLDALRRTRSGTFTLASAVTLEELRRSQGGPPAPFVRLDDLLPAMPAVRLTEEGVQRVTHGREITVRHTEGAHEGMGRSIAGARDAGSGEEMWMRMIDPDGRLLAVGRSSGTGSLHPSIVLI